MTPDLPPLPADIAAIRDALKFTNGIGKPQPSLYYAECTPERIARLLGALEQHHEALKRAADAIEALAAQKALSSEQWDSTGATSAYMDARCTLAAMKGDS